MKILHTIAEVRQMLGDTSGILGLVPTMGALHEGHLSLVRAARSNCKTVAVSIFVNPTQFAPGEDLDRYPRTLAEDRAMLEAEGVDILFAPSPDEIYPAGGAGTFVEVPGVGDRLDGASRPGHFRGVATVVAKLFNIVQPQRAYFGQKDAAQVAVLRAMVRDLNLPVRLCVCPTVRDADGLALSSRNRFLTPEQRRAALALPRALAQAKTLINASICSREPLRKAMLAELHELRVDYAEVVHPDTLEPVVNPCTALIAVAAWVGDVRLIDNMLAELGP